MKSLNFKDKSITIDTFFNNIEIKSCEIRIDFNGGCTLVSVYKRLDEITEEEFKMIKKLAETDEINLFSVCSNMMRIVVKNPVWFEIYK